MEKEKSCNDNEWVHESIAGTHKTSSEDRKEREKEGKEVVKRGRIKGRR
jgi:hypothetical protein